MGFFGGDSSSSNVTNVTTTTTTKNSGIGDVSGFSFNDVSGHVEMVDPGALEFAGNALSELGNTFSDYLTLVNKSLDSVQKAHAESTGAIQSAYASEKGAFDIGRVAIIGIGAATVVSVAYMIWGK